MKEKDKSFWTPLCFGEYNGSCNSCLECPVSTQCLKAQKDKIKDYML